MKKSIHNTLITLITVASLHDKFLVRNGEGYTKLFKSTEKTSNLMKNMIYLVKKNFSCRLFW
jgi:vacuolar-type H+-ATPase catalytic subunit A/Vma1